MAKTKLVNFRLDDRDIQRLEQLAKAHGVSQTAMLKILIRSWRATITISDETTTADIDKAVGAAIGPQIRASLSDGQSS